MCDIWKNRSWSAVDAHNSFFLIFFQFDLFFPQKVIKIGVFCTFLHCQGTLGLWKGFIHSLLTFKIFSMRPHLTYLQRKQKLYIIGAHKTSQFCPSLEARIRLHNFVPPLAHRRHRPLRNSLRCDLVGTNMHNSGI